jgi:putative flippase GtrA
LPYSRNDTERTADALHLLQFCPALDVRSGTADRHASSIGQLQGMRTGDSKLGTHINDLVFFCTNTMRKTLTRFIKFAGVGGVATALQYLMLVGFVQLLSVAPLPASMGSYLASAGFNYWANYHFTFAATSPHRKSLPRFAIVAGVGLIINALIFYTCHSGMDFMYFLAQIVATVFVLFWNFFAHHFWSFADGAKCERVPE